jgi:hypothetical protein
MDYYETGPDQCYGCKSLARRIEETEAQRLELLEVLEELFHLIDDAHDGERVFTFEMQRKVQAVIAKTKGE